eukprot:gene6824-8153_t
MPPRPNVPRPRVYVYDVTTEFTLQTRKKKGVREVYGRVIGYGFHERMLRTVHRTADPAEGATSSPKTFIAGTFRAHRDVRLPPDLFMDCGACGAPVGPLVSKRMAHFTNLARSAWRKKNTQTREELHAAKLLYFQGRASPVCAEGITPAYWHASKSFSYICFNSSNDRALVYNEFFTPPLVYWGKGITPPDSETALREGLPASISMERVTLSNAGGKTKGYMEELTTTTFCLATEGYLGGWGNRITQAVAAGCIPVIIVPEWRQALIFEDLLPWDKFAVVLNESQRHEVRHGDSAEAGDASLGLPLVGAGDAVASGVLVQPRSYEYRGVFVQGMWGVAAHAWQADLFYVPAMGFTVRETIHFVKEAYKDLVGPTAAKHFWGPSPLDFGYNQAFTFP